ncbi:MAG: NAD(P)-binding protein [Dehalococcoidia bacterium]
MPNEPVGVLVIGAGASGAAFAWSIADTGMSVLCLEQGPWMKQEDYPSNGLDWEARGSTTPARSLTPTFCRQWWGNGGFRW